MKVLAISLALLAIMITAVPLFTDCESQGLLLTLEGGRQVSMKCHWTGRAELAIGIPLFAMGAILYFTRRRETHISLGILGIILGTLVILLPTVLIGVCSSADMLCNSVMKPALILMGSLVVAINLATIVLAVMRGKTGPPG